MTFVPTTTLQEDGDRFNDLRIKLINLSNKYGYSQKDGRFDILNTLSWFTVPVLIRMGTLLSLDNNIISQEKIREVFRLYEGDLQIPLQLDINFTRWNFIVFFQFQVETLLKILFQHLKGENPPQSYSRVVERILDILKIKDKDNKIEILNVLAYARNAFHSGGIHLNDDDEFHVDNLTFAFVKGKPIEEKFSWDMIHYVADATVSILEEILDTQEVRAIKDGMPNHYVPKTP